MFVSPEEFAELEKAQRKLSSAQGEQRFEKSWSGEKESKFFSVQCVIRMTQEVLFYT